MIYHYKEGLLSISKALLDGNLDYSGITYTERIDKDHSMRVYVMRISTGYERITSEQCTREQLAKIFVDYPVFEMHLR